MFCVQRFDYYLYEIFEIEKSTRVLQGFLSVFAQDKWALDQRALGKLTQKNNRKRYGPSEIKS